MTYRLTKGTKEYMGQDIKGFKVLSPNEIVPLDSTDQQLLEIAQGATMSNTTLPSGAIVPDGIWQVKGTHIIRFHDLPISHSQEPPRLSEVEETSRVYMSAPSTKVPMVPTAIQVPADQSTKTSRLLYLVLALLIGVLLLTLLYSSYIQRQITKVSSRHHTKGG